MNLKEIFIIQKGSDTNLIILYSFYSNFQIISFSNFQIDMTK
jgi:hypothetical protein